jgi:hypothetical protein
MKMVDHMRRFSIPPPGFTAASGLAKGPVAHQPMPAPALTTLAQVYAMAHQEAVATVQQRQLDLLCKQLFDPVEDQ